MTSADWIDAAIRLGLASLKAQRSPVIANLMSLIA